MTDPSGKRFWDRFTAGALLEWAILAAVAVGLMWPVPLHPSTSFVGFEDAHYYLWLEWRVGELIQSGDILSMHIPDVVVPFGVDIRLLDGQLPTLFGGLLNLVAGPLLAYNLGLLSATALNLWAGRRLGKLFSDDRRVWVIVAVAFAAGPPIMLRSFVHFTMYFAFTAPLLVEEGVRVARGDFPVRWVRTGLLLFLAYLCSIYFLIFGGIAFALIVLVSSSDMSTLGRRAVAISGAGLVALVLMTPFLVPRLQLDRAEREAGADPSLLDDTFRAGADVFSIAAQPEGTLWDLPYSERLRANFRRDNVHEATVFPGFILLLALGALILLRSPLRRSFLVASLALWILSLGTALKIDGVIQVASRGDPVAWLPFTGLIHMPGLGSLRAANRASYTLVAVLAAALALTIGFLFARLTSERQRWLVTAASGLVLAFNLILPVPTADLDLTPETLAALEDVNRRAGDDDTVLLVPTDCIGETAADVKLQIIHQVPAVGCQSSPSALPWFSKLDLYARSEPLASLRCRKGRLLRVETDFDRSVTFEPNDLTQLRAALGVRFVVVDKLLVARPSCGSVRPAVERLRALDVLGEDGRWLIVDTAFNNNSP
ncbi:MAG: hypothetical protein M3280_00505 [Actinomycetota bacterium]|nr:hypothetical protein [Actinomycetota bacterium]